MSVESHFRDKDFTNRAVEVSIHIGLLILLTAACFVIIRPFVPLIVWGIIITIAVYPGYRKLKDALGGRGGLAAVLCTVVLLAILFVPVALLTQTLIQGIQSVAAHVNDGTLTVPPPPPNLETWPIVGVPLSSAWRLASTNLTVALRSFAPQIKTILPRLLSASVGIGLTVLQFVLSIIISGGLLAYARRGAEIAGSLADRLFGDPGLEFERLVASTIRSVTIGILGIACIQSIFAGVGFLVVGLPGAGLWTLGFLFAAVLQVGPIVLVPAVIYIFVIASSTARQSVRFGAWEGGSLPLFYLPGSLFLFC